MSEIVDASFDLEQGPKKRPVFLTVICILTFVGSGITFLSSVFGLITQKTVAEMTVEMERMQAVTGQSNAFINGLADHVVELHKWTILGNYLGLGSAILGLTGALLMWKLRKSGFFIYVVGQIPPFVTLFGMYGAVKDIPFMGFAMIIGAIFSVLFSVGFVIMYGLNLKHMR